MRRKRTLWTTITALILQGIIIAIRFILPRLIISRYGSDVNGLLNSMTQFLGYITLLEGGIGSVMKAMLYKVLAKKDKHQLSVIVVSMRQYFKYVCLGLIGYVIVLSAIYPNFVNAEFDALFTVSLLAVLAIGTFAQYFFGLSNQILLQSDQRGYVINISQIITQALSTAAMIILILNNFDIRIAKGAGTIILAFAPLSYHLYVSRHYDIDNKVKADKRVLSKRHDGLAHQISAFIHSNTDVILLTLFSNMVEVSIYSVYAMIATGMKSILNTISSGVNASLGNLYGNGEIKKLTKHFRVFNYFYLIAVVIIFTLAGTLITPFVKLYTGDITDINYAKPLFGVLIVMAEAVYCLRCSYSSLIFIAGDFKQTKRHGYIEALINIILSLALIRPLGLVGIAIGTLSGMLYRWLVSILYVHKHIIRLDGRNIAKKYLANIIAIFIFAFAYAGIFGQAEISSISGWVVRAALGGLLLTFIVLLANIILCRKDLAEMIDEYLGCFLKRKRRKL